MPEATLKALADHGEIREIMSADGGDYDTVLDEFATAGVDIYELAAKLQDEGAKSFVTSWNDLMDVIASKSSALAKAS
jgi:transaldolase